MLFWIVTALAIAAALFVMLLAWCAVRSGALYDEHMQTFQYRNWRANQHQRRQEKP